MTTTRDVALLGAFALDLSSGELTKAGRRAHLAPQASRLLVLLATRAPAVVSREEIRRALWGDQLHVEFDAAVNACISQIRSALGDSARAPRFIETVPRQGYRCLVAQPAPPLPDRPALAASPPVRSPGGARVAIALALTAAVVALVWSATAIRASGSHSLVATQKYERGISGLADAAPSDIPTRVRHFETAIKADPEFAEAFAGLAEARLMMGAYRLEAPQVAYAAAKAAAQRALTLKPSLAEAHALFGTAVLQFEWDWTLAGAHLRRAAALAPRSARVQLWWSRYLTAAGLHDAAIAAAERAVALAPGSPSALTQLGIASFYAGRVEPARTACAGAVALMPEFLPAHACRDAADGTTMTPNLLLAPAVDLVRHGDREGAFEWLQRAANRRSDSLVLAGVERGLEPLRADPRFGAVLKRVGWKMP